ncbi:sulfurtransferase TusA family protein [Hansschlegelia quercus]|uniref:Sulfurtransferase TusA family protein n=1 Tax=Hansschlegelia quercus TaxID=2528245 RepID=A0A4Q9GAH4_9HYPH|nr:sulfurtransferase TusA family protein [Hansschlegelia quercus]TBN47995.1 sulfurtransferase TusA family protein [Hansschlegelia quercus]
MSRGCGFDLRGLRCPLPALKAKRALGRARTGEQIVVISDDPLAGIDVPNAAREAGGEIVSVEPDGAASRFTMRKPG